MSARCDICKSHRAVLPLTLPMAQARGFTAGLIRTLIASDSRCCGLLLHRISSPYVSHTGHLDAAGNFGMVR